MERPSRTPTASTSGTSPSAARAFLIGAAGPSFEGWHYSSVCPAPEDKLGRRMKALQEQAEAAECVAPPPPRRPGRTY